MAYRMEIDETRRLLDVRYYDIVSIGQRMEAADEAVPLLRRTGIRRILIDLTDVTPATDPPGEHSAFARRITQEPVLLESRTAFVAPPTQFFNHIIELLADARHYPFARFADRDSALAWLLDDGQETS